MPQPLADYSFRFSGFVKAQRDLIPDGRLTWDRGGCWTLAEAVRLWLGPPVELWMLADAKEAPHHVIAKLGSHFLDTRGVQTEAKLLDTWAKHHPAQPLTLLPFDSDRAEENDLYLEPIFARRLAKRLNQLIPRSEIDLEVAAPSI